MLILKVSNRNKNLQKVLTYYYNMVIYGCKEKEIKKHDKFKKIAKGM